LAWLAAAGVLPGKALVIGLAVWFLCGVKRRPAVRLTRKVTRLFRVGRKAAYRAVKRLETAGLVRVTRKRGRGPDITVLDAPAVPEKGHDTPAG
jgi:hypothetical protein